MRIGEQAKEERAEAEADEKADIDSIDSLICACGTSTFIQLSHENAKGLPELQVLQRQGGDDSWKITYFKVPKPRNEIRRELVNKPKLKSTEKKRLH
jgi:hypothetical protein